MTVPDRAPQHTATFSADYVYSLGKNGCVRSRIQYFMSDDVYFRAAHRPEDRQPAYGLLQVRLRWDAPTEGFFIESFVENITDEDVRSTRAVGSALPDRPATASYEPPRTWGIRVGGRFEPTGHPNSETPARISSLWASAEKFLGRG